MKELIDECRGTRECDRVSSEARGAIDGWARWEKFRPSRHLLRCVVEECPAVEGFVIEEGGQAYGSFRSIVSTFEQIA
jgi:hypothetical protein